MTQDQPDNRLCYMYRVIGSTPPCVSLLKVITKINVIDSDMALNFWYKAYYAQKVALRAVKHGTMEL